ncbi:MAG: SURF1 family protein, partial [Marinicaulis sp.]|nr:SURF1 family protein [Marinicaulis sp.]
NPAPPASWFQPTTQSADGLWHLRDPALFARSANIDAVPFYLDRMDGAQGEVPAGGTTRIDFRNKHMEYALTWFGLAVTLFGVWLVFSLPKRE